MQKNNKKSIIIIVAVLLFIALGIGIYFIANSKTTDLSSYNYAELKCFLEKNGYEFKSDTLFDYDLVWCTNNKIGFSATFNKENHHTKNMTYENSDISSGNCNIWSNSQNTTEESKKLYSDYLKWLEKYNLKDTQIIDLLFNYYYEIHNIKLD